MPLAFNAAQRYRYRDYLTWPQGESWEILDGIAVAMSPAPSPRHQNVCLRLGAALLRLVEGTSCKVFVAPIDVLLPVNDEADEDVETVLQPDNVVVCDPAQIRENNLRGAPRLVMEVLSPSTAIRDSGRKRDRYERAGVQEYWLLHPGDRTVTRYRLNAGKYGSPEIYGAEDTIPLAVYEEVSLELASIFAE